jgi:type IV secretion system protein VirB1
MVQIVKHVFNENEYVLSLLDTNRNMGTFKHCSQFSIPGINANTFVKRVFRSFIILLASISGTTNASALQLTRNEFESLASRCAPGFSESMLEAVSRVESNLDPWAIHDNTTGISRAPLNVTSAFVDVSTWISHGDSVDVGLMQINSRNFSALGMTVQAALNPCESLAGGVAVLHAAYGSGNTSADAQVALLMALSRYNTGSPFGGIMNGYARRVMENAGSATLPPPVSAGVQTFSRDPNAPPSWDISATGVYAQNHGASWLVSLNAPVVDDEMQEISPVARHAQVASNRPISIIQEAARSP